MAFFRSTVSHLDLDMGMAERSAQTSRNHGTDSLDLSGISCHK